MKRNSAIQFNYWNDSSKKLKGFTKNGGFDYIQCEGFMAINIIDIYILYEMQTSTRDVYKKTVMKQKKGFQRHVYNPLEHLQWSFLEQIVKRVR